MITHVWPHLFRWNNGQNTFIPCKLIHVMYYEILLLFTDTRTKYVNNMIKIVIKSHMVKMNNFFFHFVGVRPGSPLKVFFRNNIILYYRRTYETGIFERLCCSVPPLSVTITITTTRYPNPITHTNTEVNIVFQIFRFFI